MSIQPPQKEKTTAEDVALGNSKKTSEQKLFQAVDRVTTKGNRGSNLLSKVFGRWLELPKSDDWVVDGEWAAIQQRPIKSQILLYAIALAVILLVVWTIFAEVDEVVRGEGRVVPSSQLQRLQSFDGGVVEEILVTEGQVVEPGEVLVRIDPTRFISDFRELRAEYLARLGESARLRALVTGSAPLFSDVLQEQAPLVVEDQYALYYANLEELEEREAVFRAQLAQRENELTELQAALRQHTESLSLTRRELEVTWPLRQSGAVSEVELLRLEREVTILRGEVSRTEASIQRVQNSIREAESRLREVQLTMRNEWRSQLSVASARISALEEAETGLADRVRQSEIKATSRGIVQTLHVNTVGGVVTPGRDVLDIVPLNDQLIVEARIRPQDIAFIRAGQTATVKFTAYDFMIFGGVPAEVTHISADTITDERDNTFYIVRLTTHTENVPEYINLIPGMTADVDVKTGKRTIMQYLLKPVLRATSTAFTER